MNKKKSTGIILSLLAVLSLVLITAGVTYAFFTYTKEGETENTITTGTITFYYDELQGEGNGISISDALPTSDVDGKVQVGDDNVFNFKVTATTSGNTSLPYEVTARMKSDSTLGAEIVKLYLTTVDETTFIEEGAQLTINADDSVKTFDQLLQTNTVTTAIATEKTIYNGTVNASGGDYTQNFKLRMWIDEDADFSPEVDADGNSTQVYPNSGKTFAVTINVYANATVVTSGS